MLILTTEFVEGDPAVSALVIDLLFAGLTQHREPDDVKKRSEQSNFTRRAAVIAEAAPETPRTVGQCTPVADVASLPTLALAPQIHR